MCSSEHQREYTPAEIITIQRQVAQSVARAKAINPDLPEVHAANGLFLAITEENYSASIEALNRAISGNPNNSDYYAYKGVVLVAQGKIHEAVANQMRSYELDPNSLVAIHYLSYTYT